MQNETLKIEHLKEEVLPTLFRNPADIGKYGVTRSDADALHAFSNLMETGAVSALAVKIGEIVTTLSDADPQRIAKKTTWYERLIGRDVERHVRYQMARKALDELLTETEGVAQRVRDTLRVVDEMLVNHAAEADRLRIYIQAGREFLDENPQAGMVRTDTLEFDRPRERFARKLANLAALLSSHDMSITQMKLTRAQAIDVLDRFHETSSVLVPVWRQHTLALRACLRFMPNLLFSPDEPRILSQRHQSRAI